MDILFIFFLGGGVGRGNTVDGDQLGGWERSGRAFALRPKGRRFEPHRGHCVVVLEQDTFILA